MAAYRRVYDSRRLQADCQELESAPEPYVRQSITGYLYLFLPGSAFSTNTSCFILPNPALFREGGAEFRRSARPRLAGRGRLPPTASVPAPAARAAGLTAEQSELYAPRAVHQPVIRSVPPPDAGC